MRTHNFLRTLLLTSCFASVAFVSVACDDGDDGDDGDNGTDTQANTDADTGTSGDGDTGDEECSDSVYGDQSECPEYVTCVETNCQSVYESCFGADYLNGNFGGTCADYMNCNLACDCGDTACTTDCYNTHAAMGTPCGDCIINDITACVAGNCLDAAQSCG